MKILIISSTLPPYQCGVGDYTHCLAKALVDLNIEVAVLCSSFISVEPQKYRVYPLISDWNSFGILSQILKLCLEEKYDAVHVQMPTALYGKGKVVSFIIPFLRMHGIKTVLTLHEYSFSTIGYRLKQFLPICFTNKVIVVEPFYVADICKQNKLITKKKFSFINIGSNIGNYEIDDKQIEDIRAICDPGRERLLVGSFGIISESKCFETVLETIYELKKADEWKSKLVIIGELSGKTQYQKNILNMIRQLELSEDIVITGFLEEKKVYAYLKSMDYACMLFKNGVSSRNGSFLAAMQSGLITITSKPLFDFPYSKYCRFVDNNVSDMRQAVVQMQNECGNHRIKEKSGDVAELSWVNIADRHKVLYEKL